jgi:hypothetical protein
MLERREVTSVLVSSLTEAASTTAEKKRICARTKIDVNPAIAGVVPVAAGEINQRDMGLQKHSISSGRRCEIMAQKQWPRELCPIH